MDLPVALQYRKSYVNGGSGKQAEYNPTEIEAANKRAEAEAATQPAKGKGKAKAKARRLRLRRPPPPLRRRYRQTACGRRRTSAASPVPQAQKQPRPPPRLHLPAPSQADAAGSSFFQGRQAGLASPRAPSSNLAVEPRHGAPPPINGSAGRVGPAQHQRKPQR
jgi:hypothetical protein